MFVKSNPLITILIPSYNHELYIIETIRSLISQTYKNIELIIIDDGSTDKTQEKIKSITDLCINRFSNFKFIVNEHKGIINSLNQGIALSEGEYLYVIASDDIAEDTAIEDLYIYLKDKKDVSLVVGGNIIIDSDSKICYWTKNRKITYNKNEAVYLSFHDFLEKRNKLNISFDSDDFGSHLSLMFGNYIPNGCLIRKSIFKTIGKFTENAPLEDYWMMLQISKHSKMRFLRKNLYRYRWHNSNTIKNKSKMKFATRTTFNYELNLIKNNYKSFYYDFLKKSKELNSKVVLSKKLFSIIKTNDGFFKYLEFVFKDINLKIPYKRINK